MVVFQNELLSEMVSFENLSRSVSTFYPDYLQITYPNVPHIVYSLLFNPLQKLDKIMTIVM